MIGAAVLKSLLEGQSVASLATLHRGEPAVSMVPFALLGSEPGFVVHVSRMATHTADMLEHTVVGLMVMGTPSAAESALALPRVSMQGSARLCVPESAEHERARAAYLAKIPQSEELFSFSDFSLFIIEVRSIRLVAGFGRATSVTPEQLAAVMSAQP